MPSSEFQETLYLTDEIVDEYYKRRNGKISKAEIRDLLRCVFGFIKNDNNHYAYEIQHIGTFFEPWDGVLDKDKRRDKKIAEYYYGNKYYLGRPEPKNIEELEIIQNEYFDNLKESS